MKSAEEETNGLHKGSRADGKRSVENRNCTVLLVKGYIHFPIQFIQIEHSREYSEGRKMSTGNQDYSDYIKHLSNMGSMFSFLSGFMFTAITVLVTRLPNPDSAVSQIALFFMAAMLDVFMFYMGNFYQQVLYFCKDVPPNSGKRSLFNLLSDTSVILGLGGSTVLLFLLLDLVYLALAQATIWIIMSVAAYSLVFKPYYEKGKHSETTSS